MSTPSCPSPHSPEDPLLTIYTRLLPKLTSLCKKYLQLDSTNSWTLEDLQQEAFFGVANGLQTYRNDRGKMQLNTFLFFNVQKHFQSIFSGKDKDVLLITEEGLTTQIPYTTYRKKRRTLPANLKVQTINLIQRTPLPS